MAKAVAPSTTLTAEKISSPSINLLPDKRSPTNAHSSPSRSAKTNLMNTEKKPQVNGYASPSHLSSNISNQAAKQIVEGYLRTDDRMRLAKERREERERSLAAREQLIREKERRARLQYERTVEERWRRLEEQRHKEELRRAAVEEKRRQQLEEERERLEALMRRSMERSLQLEQRNKRWSRGFPAGAGESENAPLPFSATSAFPHGIASPLPAVSESAPCSPHRSPLRSSLNPADHSRAGFHLGGSQSTPNTPKKERLRRERRTASPGCVSPIRRSESPASVTKHLAPTSKLGSKLRSQSPGNTHYSPTRYPPKYSTSDRRAEEKTVERETRQQMTDKKTTDNNIGHPAEAKNKNQSPDRKNHTPLKTDSSEKKVQGSAQNGESKQAPCTVKAAAGTTNAEEATRMLTERRRQARAQKELEEKKRELEEERRVREEQERKQRLQEQQLQEAKAREVKKLDRQNQENKEKEQQSQLEKERERAKLMAQETAERQQQDREIQKQQEEEERQLRKKRLEEIMRRTRKGEADLKREEQVDTKPVLSPGDQKTVQSKTQMNVQANQKVEFQVKEPKEPSTVSMTERAHVKKDPAEATQEDNKKQLLAKDNSHHLNTAEAKLKTSDEHRQMDILLQQGGQASQARLKTTDRISVVSPKLSEEAKVKEKGVMNGTANGEASALMRGHAAAGINTQQSPRGSAPEGKAKEGFWVDGKPVGTHLTGGLVSTPVIKLEPLGVKDSCDEMQSMEISPTSREDLISIPVFSPVSEFQHSSVSNSRALEDLMDLTGSLTCPKLSPEVSISDCNKNLIHGVVSPVSDKKLIGMSPPSSNKLST
ncbi:MAP7 domain-containing protein 2a isoform X1 [Takifugu rubripes]|uniref:MAP7 domain-containing protein 2 n=1 Tax=Takifugu rubripes TaxID=31033 RepID=A0A3B5KE42_TAKRU|nr:MAP7 domain-containing protein 2 isoform X1 [Takifugu rubripes]